VTVDIEANAFVYHMVRNIAGVLIAIGQGDRPVAWLKEVLAARDRTVAGVTAPAEGLYFMTPCYPDFPGLPLGQAIDFPPDDRSPRTEQRERSGQDLRHHPHRGCPGCGRSRG
jgi:tRNA pseudouridine38-40 synthase